MLFAPMTRVDDNSLDRKREHFTRFNREGSIEDRRFIHRRHRRCRSFHDSVGRRFFALETTSEGTAR
jgi:hypothetical protein